MCWFRDTYDPDTLRKAIRDEERRSIDLVASFGNVIKNIEVKTEFAAAKTGNIVFEVVSQARTGDNGVLGWGFKLEDTHLIAYVIPGPDEVYLFEPGQLQAYVLNNYAALRNFSAANDGYDTLGVLLPLEKAKHFCLVQATLPK